MVSPLQAQFLEARAYLEKGVLWERGALLDQHPLYAAAMGALLSEEAKILEEKRRSAETEGRGNGR